MELALLLGAEKKFHSPHPCPPRGEGVKGLNYFFTLINYLSDWPGSLEALYPPQIFGQPREALMGFKKEV
jgi:hypothetical protein